MKEKKKQKGRAGAVGFCQSCGQEHNLPAAPAEKAAFQLMKTLETADRIDFVVPVQQADPRCSLAYLRGPARGKMFGVLLAQASVGKSVHLYAFSGQYNGLWQVPGWVDPVFDLHAFHQIHDEEERVIKQLTRQIDRLPSDARERQERQELVRLRKEKSRLLMRKIHSLYRLRNFQGRIAGLEKIFSSNKGIPTGTGDCCAPKLLQQAALHGLTPLGLAEFYLGRENASGTRQHGCFYPSCRTKCYPILGFMLCGIESSEKSEKSEKEYGEVRL